MHNYILLLRGINVGGKNKIPMTELKQNLDVMGCADVRTYIQSGNVLLKSGFDADTLAAEVEAMLTSMFTLDSQSA